MQLFSYIYEQAYALF
jgi:hypothetical protein